MGEKHVLEASLGQAASAQPDVASEGQEKKRVVKIQAGPAEVAQEELPTPGSRPGEFVFVIGGIAAGKTSFVHDTLRLFCSSVSCWAWSLFPFLIGLLGPAVLLSLPRESPQPDASFVELHRAAEIAKQCSLRPLSDRPRHVFRPDRRSK